MRRFADYSAWLTAERLENEDREWLAHHGPERKAFAKLVNSVLDLYDLDKVLEFGCGTGWLGNMVGCQYCGVDSNVGCIALAWERRRNKDAIYCQGDLRWLFPDNFCDVDLVASISFLKHFALDEWNLVFERFLSFGEFGVFSVQTVPGVSFDDGTEYHHVWIGEQALRDAIRAAGHEILSETIWWKGEDGKRDVFVATRRLNGPKS